MEIPGASHGTFGLDEGVEIQSPNTDRFEIKRDAAGKAGGIAAQSFKVGGCHGKSFHPLRGVSGPPISGGHTGRADACVPRGTASGFLREGPDRCRVSPPGAQDRPDSRNARFEPFHSWRKRTTSPAELQVARDRDQFFIQANTSPPARHPCLRVRRGWRRGWNPAAGWGRASRPRPWRGRFPARG